MIGHELSVFFEYQTLWSNHLFIPSTCCLKPWILLWDRIYSNLKLMGALCLPSYLGMILFGLLFGNYGRDPYSSIHLKLVFKILFFFGFNHYVDCIKGTPMFEMFEAQIRVIASKLIALNSGYINDGYELLWTLCVCLLVLKIKYWI